MSTVHAFPVKPTPASSSPKTSEQTRAVLNVNIIPARLTLIDRLSPMSILAMAIAVSALLHVVVATVATVANDDSDSQSQREREKIEVAVIEKITPPQTEKKPELIKVIKPKPKAVNIAPPPLPETVEAPPPPNEEAPVETPPTEIVAGISVSSTSDTGSFAVGVGNTLYAAPEEVAKAPEEVKPYKAKEYSPFHLLSVPPVLVKRIDDATMEKYYPDAARKADIEKVVRVKIIIDDDGSVAKVTVLEDPGYGLAAAAQILATFLRYKPATINGRAVATEITVPMKFSLR